MSTSDKEKIQIILFIIIAVAFIGGYFNISTEITTAIVEWLVSIMVGILLSAVVGALIEAFTGDFLKKILIPIEIKGIKFSISLFAIVTIIVKLVIFGL